MKLEFASYSDSDSDSDSDLYIEHFQTTGFFVLKNREIQMK